MKDQSVIETQIKGTFISRFLLELLRNSGYFAIVNILIELLEEGSFSYLKEPDLYTIIFAITLQSYLLTKENPIRNRFFGNLIAPTIYTLFELSIEESGFFQFAHHQAYWIFSISIACIQYAEDNPKLIDIKPILILMDNITKSLLIYFMYMIMESRIDQKGIDVIGFIVKDGSHLFLLLGTLFLGIATGITEVIREKYLSLLKGMSNELRSYSEWLFGKKLLEQAVTNPDSLKLKHVDRIVLFMDIRGFTKWCENHTPEEVVTMLKKYFSTSEEILYGHDAIKVMHTGDEVLAVFTESTVALYAAQELRKKIYILLSPYGIGVGIGLNKGSVMEGIIGGDNIRHYSVIGDTVNTGKRIEGNSQANEILISSSILRDIREKGFHVGEERKVPAKGKSEPLSLYPLLEYGSL